MLLRRRLKAKTTARLEMVRTTSGLFVKGTPYTSLRDKTRVKKKTPIDTEFIKTTIIANLAALGLLAPSSLDILTLQRKTIICLQFTLSVQDNMEEIQNYSIEVRFSFFNSFPKMG